MSLILLILQNLVRLLEVSDQNLRASRAKLLPDIGLIEEGKRISDLLIRAVPPALLMVFAFGPLLLYTSRVVTTKGQPLSAILLLLCLGLATTVLIPFLFFR